MEDHGVGGYAGGKVHVLGSGIGNLYLGGEGTAFRVFQGEFVAGLEGGQGGVLRVTFGRNDLVEGGDGLSGADFAGVFAAVFEFCLAHEAVFISKQTVFGDSLGIEADLALGIVGDGPEVAALVHEDLDHLLFAVDIVIGAVAVVGQALHAAVLVVAGAEAHDAQVDAALLVALDHLHQRLRGGNAHVEIAVGAHDDAVVAALNIVGRCFVVGHLHGRAAGGAATGE